MDLGDGEALDSRHMLHFAHEAARYQVDVAKMRRQNHRLETQLRDTQRVAAEERVSLNQRIEELTQQVDRSVMITRMKVVTTKSGPHQETYVGCLHPGL